MEIGPELLQVGIESLQIGDVITNRAIIRNRCTATMFKDTVQKMKTHFLRSICNVLLQFRFSDEIWSFRGNFRSHENEDCSDIRV